MKLTGELKNLDLSHQDEKQIPTKIKLTIASVLAVAAIAILMLGAANLNSQMDSKGVELSERQIAMALEQSQPGAGLLKHLSGLELKEPGQPRFTEQNAFSFRTSGRSTGVGAVLNLPGSGSYGAPWLHGARTSNQHNGRLAPPGVKYVTRHTRLEFLPGAPTVVVKMRYGKRAARPGR